MKESEKIYIEKSFIHNGKRICYLINSKATEKENIEKLNEFKKKILL